MDVRPVRQISTRAIARSGFGRATFAGAVVMIALLGARAYGGGSVSDDAAIRGAVTGGINQLMQATIVAPAGQTVAANAISSRIDELPQALGQYFVGAPLLRYTATLEDAVAQEATSPEHDVGGGTKQVIFTAIEISTTTASVKARSLDWVQRAPAGNGPASAEISGWWDYTIHLAKTAQGWRIDEISFSPEAGSEP